MATLKQIEEIYSSYFTPSAQSTSRVTPEIIQTILKLNKDKKIGSVLISEVLSKEPYNIKINQSQIGRILKTGRDNKLITFIPRTEMKTSVDQRIYDDKSNRRIYKTIRNVREQDFTQYTGRGNKPPKGTKFKITFAYPSNSADTVIPKKFQGTQYYKTKELAEEALKAENIFDARAERKIPFNNAVKQIHKIALKKPDEITSIKNLSKLIYGSDSIKDMTMVSNDIVRYQEFLLGFKTIPGLTIPPKDKLNDILSEFPSQNQWGKFASEELRRSKLKIRDALIDNKGTKLQTLRDNIVKLVNSKALELDEAMGISATYKTAPGLTELGQIIPKNINQLKNRQIDQPFGRLLERVVNGETGSAIKEDIKAFNKISKDFQKLNKVDTAILTYKPGEILKPTDFIKQFDKLSPEARINLTDLAKKGIAVKSNAAPMADLLLRATKEEARLGGPICKIFRSKGGRIGFAKGTSCVVEVEQAIKTDAKKFAQDINKTEGVASTIKNAGTKFLIALKTPGSFRGKVAIGAGAVIAGGGAAALVSQFRNDDKSTYLTSDRQMEGMVIADDVEKDLDDMGFILDNEGKIELAATGALSASMVKQVYNAARAGEAQLLELPKGLDQETRALTKTIKQITHRNGKKVKRITESGQQVIREARDRLNQIAQLRADTKLRGTTGDLINPGKSGKIMSALGLRKGVLGLGLNAFMAPAVALPTAAFSLARDIKSGKSVEDTVTNPFTYLPAAFMRSGLKGLGKMGATRGLMAVAGLGLGSVAAAPVVGAISVGAGLATLGSLGYQGYKMFRDRNKSDEDFFN